MTQQELPVHKTPKGRSRKTAVVLTLVIVLLVCSIAGLVLGAAARHRRETAAQAPVVTCGDFVLTNRDLSYYYWSEYFYFANAVGESLAGFDASARPDRQMYDDTRTWQDYFLERTLITVRDTVSMALAARAADFALPEDYQSAYERVLSQFDEAAEEQGYSDTDAYLRASFGPAATRESFAQYLYDTHLASAYSDEVYEAIDVSGEDAAAYRDLHEADYAGCQSESEALGEAADDLRSEQYQNMFLSLTGPYLFQVDYDAIVLYEPAGLFEAK